MDFSQPETRGERAAADAEAKAQKVRAILQGQAGMIAMEFVATMDRHGCDFSETFRRQAERAGRSPQAELADDILECVLSAHDLPDPEDARERAETPPDFELVD